MKVNLWAVLGLLMLGVSGADAQQADRPAVAGEKQKPDSAVPQ